MAESVEYKKELAEVLYRLSWKWAVLVYYTGKVARSRELPKEIIDELGLVKSLLDSGCYSACEIMEKLRYVEKVLFPYVIELGVSEASNFMEMLSKAMAGKLTPDDVDIEIAKPVLSDCSFPCTCDRKYLESWWMREE